MMEKLGVASLVELTRLIDQAGGAPPPPAAGPAAPEAAAASPGSGDE
jgi:hypothetical protein